MSLLNKASLIQIPSGYKDGTLYSAKPTNGDGDFTFSRGSNLAATRVNSDGLIEKGRENILYESNNFSSGYWNYRAGDSSTGGQAGYDDTNDAWLLSVNNGGWSVYQNYVGTGVHTFSLYVKAGTANIIQIDLFSASTTYSGQFNLSNGTDAGGSNSIDRNIISVGGGWYRVSFAANISSTLYARIGTVTQTGNFYIQDAQLEQGLVATDYIETTTTTEQAGILEDMPRLDYSGGATCGHLILEPQRSNLVTNSEYYSASSWQNVGATITNNNTTSPEGKQNATLLVGTSGSASRVQDFFGALSGAHTYSLFIKSTGVATRLNLQTNDVGGATFSVPASGTPTVYAEGTNIGDPFIEDYGSGWYRVGFSFTPTGGGVNNYFQIYPDSSGNISSIYVYGAQCEAGSYPTSYIPTYGSSVTRGVDIVDGSVDSNLFNDDGGVLFVEFAALADTRDNEFRFLISDGTNNERIQIGLQTSNTLYCSVIVSNSAVADFTTSLASPSSTHKVAIRYKSNDFAAYVDGTQIGTDTSGGTPSGLDRLDFYRTPNNNNYVEANVKQTIYFNTALTNDELASLTTI